MLKKVGIKSIGIVRPVDLSSQIMSIYNYQRYKSLRTDAEMNEEYLLDKIYVNNHTKIFRGDDGVWYVKIKHRDGREEVFTAIEYGI
jgi:hypothetical protein